ncbi:RICIN domain-containing protein [Bacillus mycoides]|uniref:RICIN domain-containing protein n=1 Tax=Bacillus mycoides TaxID=1405 RepID=UPI003D65E020
MAIEIKQNKFYEIRPAKDVSKVVQVGWGADSNGDTFEIYPPSREGGDWQKFLIFPLDDDYYAIVCKNSGLMMKVSRDDNDNGRWIEQWEWLDEEWEQARESVYFEDRGSNTYAFQYKGTGKYMALSNRSTHDGNVCEQWEWQGGDWQYWKLTELSDSIVLPRVETYPPPVAPDYDPIGGINQVLPEKSPTVTTNTALLPFFMVNDPYYTNVLQKFKSNPYYLLVKKQYYEKIAYQILSPSEVYSYTETSGITETEQKEFEQTVSMTIGMDYGLQYKKFSASLKYEISNSIRTLVSNTVQHSKETTTTRTITNPLTQSASWTQYQLVTEYQVLRANGTPVDSPWSVKQENHSVSRFYPNAQSVLESTKQKELFEALKNKKTKCFLQ